MNYLRKHKMFKYVDNQKRTKRQLWQLSTILTTIKTKIKIKKNNKNMN